MKDIAIKLRYIYVRYLLIAIGFIVGYSALRWYLDYQLGVLHLKEDLLDLWIPLILPIIPILLWLRKEIRCLNIRGQNNDRAFVYQLIAGLFIFIPTTITQEYIEASSGQLKQVVSPYEITKASNIDCYKISDFNVIKDGVGVYATSRTSGRHNQTLAFTIYFVVPLVEQNEQVDLSKHKYWYGFHFTQRMSNHASNNEKRVRWNAFYEESLRKYEQYDCSDYEYLQGVAYSDENDGYVEAIKRRQKNSETDDCIILKPIDKPFADRTGNKVAWILGTFGIGAFIFLLMVLIPSVNHTEFRRYRDKKTLPDDDLKYILNFFIPRGSYFATAILLNANLIVFLLLVILGVNVISATPQELFELGALRRSEVLNGEVWRLFTSMFLHGGFLHLSMNLFGIGLTCALTEPILGRTKTFIAYTLSGLGASLASIYWHENMISVGASGAIFGMMGVMVALLLTKKAGQLHGTFWTILIAYGGLNLLLGGLLGGIDNAAHIGGLLTGIVIGLILKR